VVRIGAIRKEAAQMSAIMHTYMERPGEGVRPLSDVSIYRHGDCFAVEEVVGTIDEEGHRRGEIVTLAAGLAMSEAERRYAEAVAARKKAGFSAA
jgi:hypothetical protein